MLVAEVLQLLRTAGEGDAPNGIEITCVLWSDSI